MRNTLHENYEIFSRLSQLNHPNMGAVLMLIRLFLMELILVGNRLTEAGRKLTRGKSHFVRPSTDADLRMGAVVRYCIITLLQPRNV